MVFVSLLEIFWGRVGGKANLGPSGSCPMFASLSGFNHQGLRREPTWRLELTYIFT